MYSGSYIAPSHVIFKPPSHLADHFSCQHVYKIMECPRIRTHLAKQSPLHIKIWQSITSKQQLAKTTFQALSPVLLVLGIILLVYFSLCTDDTSIQKKRPYHHDPHALRALAAITALISLSLFGSTFGSWRSNKKDSMELEGLLWDCAVLQLMSAFRAVTLLWGTAIVADRWFKQG
jgi:hypothetical protein